MLQLQVEMIGMYYAHCRKGLFRMRVGKKDFSKGATFHL